LGLIVNSGCDNSIEPIIPVEKKPYMSLNIGDIRQYYSDIENIYLQLEIIDTAYRSDGQKVYVADYSILLPDGIYKTNVYHFIRDGYFWQTAIDSVMAPAGNEINPFMESKIINIYPQDGEIFLRTKGVSETDKVFHKINLIDSLETYAQTFENVEECEIIDADTLRNIWLYYAPDYGHVGTLITNPNGVAKISLTYIKVGNSELGQFVSFNSNNNIPLIDEMPNIMGYLFFEEFSNYTKSKK